MMDVYDYKSLARPDLRASAMMSALERGDSGAFLKQVRDCPWALVEVVGGIENKVDAPLRRAVSMMAPSELAELVDAMPEQMKSNREMQVRMGQELSKVNLGASFGFLSQAMGSGAEWDWAKKVGKCAITASYLQEQECQFGASVGELSGRASGYGLLWVCLQEMAKAKQPDPRGMSSVSERLGLQAKSCWVLAGRGLLGKMVEPKLSWEVEGLAEQVGGEFAESIAAWARCGVDAGFMEDLSEKQCEKLRLGLGPKNLLSGKGAKVSWSGTEFTMVSAGFNKAMEELARGGLNWAEGFDVLAEKLAGWPKGMCAEGAAWFDAGEMDRSSKKGVKKAARRVL